MRLLSGDMDFRGDFASALGWWAEAGVDTLVDDSPRDWLARPAAPAAAIAAAQAAPTLPDTLEAFVAWRLAAADLPDSALPRVPPLGRAGADLMVLVDRPDAGEAALLTGPAGALFDRMLAAIGLDRDACYVAPLMHGWSAAPPSADDRNALAILALRHVALATPRRLLILGDATARALLGAGVAESRQRLHALNHEGGSVSAVASFHPRFLLDRPAMKAAAWQDLLLLTGDPVS